MYLYGHNYWQQGYEIKSDMNPYFIGYSILNMVMNDSHCLLQLHYTQVYTQDYTYTELYISP